MLYLLPFAVSLLFFIGAYFTNTSPSDETKENIGKGTLIKIFMFIAAAGFMGLSVSIAEVPVATAHYSYPAYQVWINSSSNGIATNTIQSIPQINVTETDNPLAPNIVLVLGWMQGIYIIICILFSLFTILTGGVTVKQ